VLFLGLIFLSKFEIFEDLIEELGYRDFYKCAGAIFYTVGIILILLFVKEKSYIISFIYILAVCDTVPSFFEKPKKRIFKRGILGIFTSLIFTAPIPIFLLGVKGLLFSLVCVAIEAANLKINDNILIPIACILAKELI
jgi:dolichol kinase